jgi:putative transposase
MHKRVRRSIHIPGRAYFVTTIVRNREEYFNNLNKVFIILKSLTITSVLKNCEIIALAVMPDHLHLIMHIGNYSTTKIMQLFKSFSAVEINKTIEERVRFTGRNRLQTI